jgi:hypothetical protein
MFFSVVITVYEADQIFLPRVVMGLMSQTFKDFEVIVVVDGEAPLAPYDPQVVFGKTIPATVVYRPRSKTIGFRERHFSLGLAKGRYIVWLNADNGIYPHWLQSHYENAIGTPGAISVVNIHYWLRQNFWGVLPTALAYGHFDLLNYALPLELAYSVGVFGPDVEHLDYADWVAFERCSNRAPVVWKRDQPVCACHY